MDWISEPMLALYGTIFGGVGLKVIEWFLGRAGARENTATAIRTELREELSTVRVEMDKLKHEVAIADKEADRWRDKYYSLVAAIARDDLDEARRHLGR